MSRLIEVRTGEKIVLAGTPSAGVNYTDGGELVFLYHANGLFYSAHTGGLYYSEAGLWTPADITTAAWFDAADEDTITEAAGLVSQWDDKSSNGYDVDQVTGSLQPTTGTRTINGLNAIDFDSDILLNTADASNIVPVDTDVHAFFVGSYDTIFPNIVVYTKDGTPGLTAGTVYNGYGHPGSLEIHTGTAQSDPKSSSIFQDGTPSSLVYEGSDMLADTPYIQMARWDRSNANEFTELWLDGVKDGEAAGGVVSDLIPSTFILGGHGDSGSSLNRRFDGILGECIIVHGSLSTETRQKIEGYLAWKWGLEDNLPYGHPYKNGAPLKSGLPSAPANWTVAQIATDAWYDPSEPATIIESAGLVSQCNDKSGNGEHLIQTTGSSQPITGTRTLNGLNVLDCDGDDVMEKSSFPVPASGDIAIFAVAEIDSISNGSESIFSMNGTTHDFQFDSESATQFDGEIDVSDIGLDAMLTGGPFSGPSIYNNTFDFTGIGAYNAFIDGTQRAVNTTYSAKLNASQTFRIFGNRTGARNPNGAFGEVVVVEDCSTECRQRIEGYLAWKWGLQLKLPPGHPYESAPPVIAI